MDQGIMALQNSGRGEDTRLAHLMQGEVVVPPHILARNKSLKKALERHLAKTGTNLSDITVGSGSINPNTGLEEFGFLSKLWKKVKKVVEPVAQVARFIPGPWQVPANIYVKGKAAVNLVKGEGGIGDFATLFTGGKLLGETGDLAKFADKGFQFGSGQYTLGNLGEGIKSALGFGQTTQDYTIKSGDTLSDIAAANNTTVEALAKANNITDPSKIFAGQTLSVPGSKNVFSRVGDFVGGLDDTPGFQFSDITAGMQKLGDLNKGFSDSTGVNPALLAMAKYYGDATEKALEKESGGMGDIRQSLRPDLAYSTYGGIGGFDLGYAEGGEVMDMRNGGESVGPGTGTSDDIPAMLSDGEFVMTAKANLGAGSVGLKKGKGGIMELVPQGEPDRQRGADNMMTLMRYFEARA